MDGDCGGEGADEADPAECAVGELALRDLTESLKCELEPAECFCPN